MKTVYFIISSLLLWGCAGNSKSPPSYTFDLVKESCSDNVCDFKLDRNPESAIKVRDGDVMRLSVESTYVTSLPENSALNAGQFGNRELLLYAIIYKNGQFLKYEKITDVAEHVSVYQPVVVHRPEFFTESVRGYYHIIIKGYEVDTKALVKFLRRTRNTDIDSIEQSGFHPGDTFTSGLKNIVFGFFDVVLSVTGKSLDDWAANVNATKVFEHSVYLTTKGESTEEKNILIVGSGDNNLFETCNEENICTAESDIEIYKHAKTNIKKLESIDKLSSEDLKKGKVAPLEKSPYIWIKAEHLTTQN
ncbi:hypothetical protein [Vibrio europaeus]|uniref:hypothetical protein n=1 Tax=Vibrio europaeus TaxID=300876 RepID=UPI00148B90A6|nr:hypothetical protein [Vibrio europaeus]MDC5853573.1 hypothetical protein [Vibrio europaeus]NOH24695.1 hypothetical protein [Vibrio europaeus]